ncbi:MAG TPA: MBL fold metallo-hydrolase [Candidatus Acidoferrum sp.]|jgi:beta-lactamase superfamily II metal-dependent hydrolase|nr:MBL fold metallo-hydrolase [Candidatus Acidoferrum sp.]
MAISKPPAADEIEICVFGPGTGETILIHCTGNEWICVDCTTSEGKCWPLSYLGQIGVQPDAVRLIVATHWHSDHVKGLSELVRVCGRAQLVCSGAIRSDEFKMIVARFSSEEVGVSRAPLSEVKHCFELLAARKGNPSYKPPNFAHADQTLDRFTVGSRTVEVFALSPSPQDRLDALEAFAKYFVPVDEPATGLSPIDQNHASVVLSIRIDDEYLLLGADLERTNSQHTGWNAIVASTIRPQALSTLFKVPHHGSSNAQSDDVWRLMLIPSACAVVTPYAASQLPRPEGLQWLTARTSEAYATSLATGTRIRRRPEVERIMKESTADYSSQKLPEELGMVRFRKRVGSTDSWTAETFGDGQKL